MQIAITFIAVIILISGILYQHTVNNKDQALTIKKSSVLSVKNEDGEDMGNGEIRTEIDSSTESTNIPTVNPTIRPTPAGTSQDTSPSDLINYKYPNSKIISSNSTSLQLESSDLEETITNWYKDKITDNHMNVKTFVTTKSNDQILNKLVGANAKFEVRVDIAKESSESKVKITVSVSIK